MNGLTAEQREFIKHHKIDRKFIFDANGLTRKEYRVIMKELGKIIAFNVSECYRGHSLRTRSGHCCQCDPAKITFQRRHETSGVIYIAKSKIGDILKIGFTKAREIRSESLNRTKYAGLSDWKVVFSRKSPQAGKIEAIVTSELHDYAVTKDYEHNGHIQYSSETFKCSFPMAMGLVLEVIESNGFEAEPT